jgi:hypothetical protein
MKRLSESMTTSFRVRVSLLAEYASECECSYWLLALTQELVDA